MAPARFAESLAAVVQYAAIAHEKAASGVGNDFTSGEDAVLKRHDASRLGSCSILGKRGGQISVDWSGENEGAEAHADADGNEKEKLVHWVLQTRINKTLTLMVWGRRGQIKSNDPQNAAQSVSAMETRGHDFGKI